MKRYDEAYYNRWYRNRRTRVVTPETLERKVRLAVATAEYMLGRPIASVLDVGAGEGAWYPVVRRLRRGVRYMGLDPSEYVVRRFGRRRNLRQASFGELPDLRLREQFDLIVCSDVLQYVTAPDLAAGLAEIRRLLRGVAFIEAYTTDDHMEGDRDGWQDRTPAAYRQTPCSSSSGVTAAPARLAR